MSPKARPFKSTPHPFVKEPYLYIANPPARVRWEHLQPLFASCGTVRFGGEVPAAKRPTYGKKTWKIVFSSVYYAEMAFATVLGADVPGVEPSWSVNLWASPALTPAIPEKPALPVCFFPKITWAWLVRGVGPEAHTIFQWFRPAGPILAVHLNVDIGYGQPACLVEYYRPEHQQAARIAGATLHQGIAVGVQMPFRVIDPRRLYCANLGSDARREDLLKEFSPFGKIFEANMMKKGTPDAWGIVSFVDRHNAAEAMSSMRTLWPKSKNAIIRYYEPKNNREGTSPAGASLLSSAVWYAPASLQNEDNTAEGTADEVSSSERLEHEPKTTWSFGNMGPESGSDPERLEHEPKTPWIFGNMGPESPGSDTERLEHEPKTTWIFGNMGPESPILDTAWQSEPLVSIAETQESEANAAKAAEAHAKAEAIRIAQLEIEAAQAAEKKALDDKDLAEHLEESLVRDLAFAESIGQNCKREYMSAETAFDEATQDYEEALERRDEAREVYFDAYRQSEQADAETQKAAEELDKARTRKEEAEREALRARRAREAAEAKLREATRGDGEDVDEDDEETRREKLAESIRKMAELREQEELDRARQEAKRREAELEKSRRRMAQLEAEEKERKRAQQEAEERAKEEARRAAEVQRRREKEEAERIEREKREAEEKARARQQAYEKASARERERCQERDRALHVSLFWNLSRSIERFRLVSAEFDDIKFCATQPLTFESIPWPIHKSPFAVSLGDVEWQAVEQFFAGVRGMVSAEEYRTMVEKAHRRFHPDKWRARGLLFTVLDEDLRQRLETAGNVVSQALGPIWTESRSQ